MYEILNEEFFREFDKGKKFNIEYGGSGSGKSVSVAQYMILGLISGDGYRRAVFRKSFPSLKLTTYLLLKEVLSEWNIDYEEHKTDHFFQVGKNRLYYVSFDDPDKIKGMEMKEIWLEESSEFTEEDFNQLTLRLARDKHSEDARFFLTFNPVDENCWCVKKIDYARQNADTWNVHHSTYKDNVVNLSQNFIDRLEKLIEIDEVFYKVYVLGEPGVLQNRIYNHFIIEDSNKWPMTQMLASGIRCYGIDFGFNNPMCLVEAWYYEDEFYIKEKYYKSERTTDDLAIWMMQHDISTTDYIFADSAEPDRIEQLSHPRNISTVYKDTGTTVNALVPGYNVLPAKKDVKSGIDFLKSKKIHVCSMAINGIKEYQGYRFKKTKDGMVIDEPIKLNDHFMDAIRYACFTLGVNCGIVDDLEIKNERVPPVGFSVYEQFDGIYENYGN